MLSTSQQYRSSPVELENLGKMGRLSKQSDGLGSVASRVNNIRFRPVIVSRPQAPHPNSDSDSDIRHSLRRAPKIPVKIREIPYIKQEPIPLEPKLPSPDVNNDSKADIERWRNKQRQREKMRAARNVRANKEEDRHSSKMNRDQEKWLRSQNQAEPVIQPNIRPNAISSHVARRMQEARSQRWHRSRDRSGYSTPGNGYSQEMKIGRNMRAGPRRADGAAFFRGTRSAPGLDLHESQSQPLLASDHTSRVDVDHLAHLYTPPSSSVWTKPSVATNSYRSLTSPQHPTQDLLETLNRQQLLYQRQNDLQKQVAEQQDLKRRAQQLVNEALLRDDIAAKRRNEQELAQVKQLLSSSYSMPGRPLDESQAIINESQQLSPKSQASPRLTSRPSIPGQNTLSRSVPVATMSSTKPSALEQLLCDGKISETQATSRSLDMVNPYGQPVTSPYQLAATSLYLPSPPGGAVVQTGNQQLAADDKEKLIQAVRDELQRLQPS